MIIGVAGKMNAGKDEIGKIIKSLDGSFKIVKYADRLKEITALLLGCPREKLEDREFKESPLKEEWWIKDENGNVIKTTPRWMLQHIGTDCFRNLINPNTWVISTLSSYDDSQNWVITDVRFPNEVEGIKKLGGIVIRVKRPTDDLSNTHISETALDNYNDFDFIINNDGSIDDLREKIIQCKII